MPLNLPNDFANGQVADAAPVQENYTLIESYVSNHVIADDGSVGMQAPLLLHGDPTEEDHAANKGYVDNVLPVGIIFPWPSAAPPTGTSGASVWLLCNGQSLQQAAYPELFGKVGLGYGTTVAGEFRLPNMNGRVMVGVTPTVANGGKAEFDTLGKQGGQYTVPLPSHTHGSGTLTTGDNDVAHTHDMTHIHAVDHNHASATTSSTGAHTHDSTYVGHQNLTAGPMALDRGIGAGAANLQGTDSAGAHTHSVDLQPFAGNSGPSTRGLTTTDSVRHKHNVTIPAAGVTATGGGAVEHLVPYVTINFIIKAK